MKNHLLTRKIERIDWGHLQRLRRNLNETLRKMTTHRGIDLNLVRKSHISGVIKPI